MSRDMNDPRIVSILARLEEWRLYSESHDSDSVGRYAEQLLDRIALESASYEKCRAILTAILAVADDETIDELSDEANGEQQIYLQCTVGNDISAALQTCGMEPYQAEQLAHKVIAEALETVPADVRLAADARKASAVH